MATLTVRTVTTLSALLVSRDEVVFDPDFDSDSDFDGWWISLREIQWLRWLIRNTGREVLGATLTGWCQNGTVRGWDRC
jgi:hypothetical protein